MRFVQTSRKSFGKKSITVAGPRTGAAIGKVSGVILDAGAEAHLLHHFQIELRAHLDALGFEKLGVCLEPYDPFIEFLANGLKMARFILS